jgi:hypothetical protein
MQRTLGALCALLLLVSSAVGDDRLVGNLGDPKCWRFSGVESFDSTQMRVVLPTRFALLAASHPYAPAESLLQELREAVELGYRTRGFPDAKVDANINPDGQFVDVSVREGPRFRCGDLRITGNDGVPAEALRTRLIDVAGEPQERGRFEDVMDMVVCAARRYAERGRDRKADIWNPGAPARFDRFLEANVQHCLREEFEQRGYYMAKVRAQVVRNDSNGTADLHLEIEEGPRALIGEVSIQGAERNTREQILNVLNLDRGGAFDRELPARLETRLCETGRFRHVKVTARGKSKSDGRNPGDVFLSPVRQLPDLPGAVDTENADDGNTADSSNESRNELLKRLTATRKSDDPTAEPIRETAHLNILVEEHEQVPALNEPLSETQQVFVKLAEWIRHWGTGESGYDLTIDVEIDLTNWREKKPEMPDTTPPDPTRAARVLPRFVLSAERGVFGSIDVVDGNSVLKYRRTMLIDRQRFAMNAADRGMRIDRNFTGRLVLDNALDPIRRAQDGENSEDAPQLCMLRFGWGIKTKNDSPSVPVWKNTRLSPAVAIVFANACEGHCKIREGRLQGEVADCRIDIDAETGRLIEYSVVDAGGQYRSSIRSAAGAFEQCVKEFNETAKGIPGCVGPHASRREMADYVIDEMSAMLGGMELDGGRRTLHAWCKLLENCNLPDSRDFLGPLNALSDSADDAFGMAGADWHAEFDISQGIPIDPNTVGIIAALSQHVLPFPQRLSRCFVDRLLMTCQDPRFSTTIARRSFQDFLQAPEAGPVSLAIGAWLAHDTFPASSSTFARKAMSQMTSAAFVADCRLLWDGDFYVSRLVLSLAEAVRQLEDAEIRALAGPWQDQAEVRAVLDALETLNDDRSQPVREILPRVAGRFWELGLQEFIEAGLSRFAPTEPVRETGPFLEIPVNAVSPQNARNATRAAARDQEKTLPR